MRGTTLSPENNIPRLRELTSTLLDFPAGEPEVITYQSGDEVITHYGISKCKEYAVSRAFLPAGTKFPVHSHEEREYVIVISGRMIAEAPDGKELPLSDHYEFAPELSHNVYAPVDTWVLGITVPAAEGYPNG